MEKAIIMILTLCGFIYFVIHLRRGYLEAYENSHPARVKSVDKKFIPYRLRNFSFLSGKGIRLSAIEYIPDGRIKGTVIACHYLGGSKYSIYFFIEPLLRNGYRVVAYDYPNHGDSMDRKSSRFTLEADVKNFIRVIKEHGLNGPFAVIGYSMGVTAAIAAAGDSEDIKALIADSGPLIYAEDYTSYIIKNKRVNNRIERLACQYTYRHIVGFNKMRVRMGRSVRKLRDKRLPVLIFHGKRDEIIPCRNAIFFNRQLRNPLSKLIVVEKARHLTNMIVLGEEYEQLIVEFLDKYLAGNNF